MNDLYSLNRAWPQELPFRVRTPDSGTRTNPDSFTKEELKAWGYVGPFEKPSYDETTQVLKWTGGGFMIRNMTADERESVLLQRWTVVRTERNRRLQECDWTQLSDSPANKEEWAAYRQLLRDITSQPDPFAIDWPVPPALD